MAHAFTVLGPHHHGELAGLIAIYQEAIDPSEQKTPAEIEAMLSDPRYVLMVSHTNGMVSGFSISMFPQGAGFWLLEYMAVASSVRSGGVGAAVFNEAYRYGLGRAPSAIMVLEVDQPGGSTNPANDTHARFRFYRRIGCRRIAGLDYILPLESGSPPPAMMLLTYRIPSLVALPRDEIRRWLETIYVSAYGKRRDDPRIEKMLSLCPATLVALPL